ncbi:twin-arginine translocation pathway signal [Thioalkalivibrio nitratireducens DSM 14787]|uniref:Twin-arginine translocation pathway signal n=1 Tax=Thioalkalivibrio nitratireducens (strain DSM 14787 / UNIQEM 213 / ALEN2) TaxID=1255043 RepID=L0DV00_THIND|nr:nitrous oxide reductase accessory protein NosL [Thioalkalivibrio nitratireducens]AGA32191.1 twin-arginine translocation pathway signal [Thioalkalivibrio nitratireducens DSM 14787]
MNRRHLLKGTVLAGLAATFGKAAAAEAPRCDGDGTPLQFMPKAPPDPDPLRDELEKYPRCPYCGMDRRQWQHSRHLVHYDDDRVDGTCSLHCTAISLSLNIDRGPKAIYVADYGSGEELRPLVNVDAAQYLIGSSLPGTMTARSKMAFASRAAAETVQQDQGGELGDFDAALTAAYLDMARDTAMIRRRRAERRARMQQQRPRD